MAEPIAHVTVRSTVAPLVGEPRVSAAQISQLIRGHGAELLARQDAWCRIRGIDGYEGWCHQGYLSAPLPVGTQGHALRSGWNDEQRMSLSCTIRRDDGSQIALPLGALLGADEVVVAGLAMNARGRKRYFAPDARLLIRRAVDLFAGAPYQWGGVTPWGADCSGFVQTMFALHGVQLPRDAWQQGEIGKNVPGDLRELYPADLLFFSDRDDAKITHVAISLGGSSIVHVSLANGGYGIDAIDASTPVAEQLQKTFRFAKRIL